MVIVGGGIAKLGTGIGSYQPKTAKRRNNLSSVISAGGSSNGGMPQYASGPGGIMGQQPNSQNTALFLPPMNNTSNNPNNMSVLSDGALQGSSGSGLMSQGGMKTNGLNGNAGNFKKRSGGSRNTPLTGNTQGNPKSPNGGAGGLLTPTKNMNGLKQHSNGVMMGAS